jgi:hypothetical protein
VAAGHDSFVAVNLGRNVAITHALVIGWVSTTIMGASYQLGPVVIGGNLWSERLARVQFSLHMGAVVSFVWGLALWDTMVMGFAGSALFLSFVLYVLNMGHSVWSARTWTLTRGYLAASLALLVVAFALGITWVGALQPSHLWFPITLGRLSAHAHLGLVGWLGLAVMGVSYQLAPMFNVVTEARPRWGWQALAITVGAVALFAAVIALDPAAWVRPLLAAVLAVGPLLWGADQLRLMRHRSRRRLDVQGRAVFLSLGFLVLTVALGLGASFGSPLTPDDEPARWLLAYGAAGIVGWIGSTLIGNSYKILPFLVWYHRYRARVGREPVPMVNDLYNDSLATAALALNGLAALVLVMASLTGSVELLRAGGAVIAIVGVAHATTMATMFLPKKARVPASATAGKAVAP